MRPAAAFEAGEPVADLLFRGVGGVAQQRRRGHDPAIEAIAALRHLLRDAGGSRAAARSLRSRSAWLDGVLGPITASVCQSRGSTPPTGVSIHADVLRGDLNRARAGLAKAQTVSSGVGYSRIKRVSPTR